MQNLQIKATNAYGIRSIDHNFTFKKGSCIAIYAPNGTCKTSLRKAMEAWSDNASVRDAFFPGRSSSFSLTTTPGGELKRENVICFQSMGDLARARFFDDRLLASPDLKARYIRDKEAHDAELKGLLSSLRKEVASGNNSPKDDEMTSYITELTGTNNLVDALSALVKNIESREDPLYVTKYKLSDVLCKSVENALAKPGVQESFSDYAKVRNEVLEKSVYFGNGFDYLAASSLATELEKSKFFDAGHTLMLRNRDDASVIAIESCEEFKSTIDAEIARIDSDPIVIAHFKTADEKLGRVAAVKKFKALIGSDSELASAIADPPTIKLAYLNHAARLHKEEISQYLKHRKAYLRRMTSFNNELSVEKNDWDKAIQMFLNRFRLPVRPFVKNRGNVVLGIDEPSIAFKYQDSDVDNDVLMTNLSEGEKKALYMLSVIFEVERSKRLSGPKLYVFDDVVDSFDYINKYAFIEYLRDFVGADDAYAILLTHNFDFFRTVTSRLGSNFERQNCLVAEKDAFGKVDLKAAEFINKNPLTAWKSRLANDEMKIASIAMVRELVEMREGSNSRDYALLSSVLHGRKDGQDVTFNDMSDCFLAHIGCNILAGDNRKVQDVLAVKCKQIVTKKGRLELQDKIVLSIGIRTMVERYILKSFAEHDIEVPTSNTLGKLIGSFKDMLPEAYLNHADCMEQASLIVPENIHINGFMYEPLVDIGSHRFVNLYQKCLTL